MVSNRLIALALVAALVQAWTLSFRLAAAAGGADEKNGAASPPLSSGETSQQFAWYCKADEEPAWSSRNQTALQLSSPNPLMLDGF